MPATYEIVPGKSVGPFMLGDTLWHILDLVRTEKTRFPKVEIAWDTSKPQSSDLTLSLPNLTLYFPDPTQRLSLLKVTSIVSSSLTLSLEDQVLHSSSQKLTRGVVGRVLGPTYSGDGSSLVYPGVKFGITSPNPGSSGRRDDPVESLTVVTKDEAGALPDITPLGSVTIKPNEGVSVYIPHEVSITVGETTGQDLLLELGPPLRKYVKEDDRMERIWGGTREDSDVTLRSTFWNYFQYGIDFLISPEGDVQKILLHSNIPGTPLFQRHARCPWTLPTSSGPLTHSSALSSFRAHFSGDSPEHLQVPTLNGPSGQNGPTPSSSTGGGKKKNKNRNPSPSVSDNSDSSEIKSSGFVSASNGASAAQSSSGEADGMILDRVVEGGLDGVENLSPSRLVDFEGLIVEEDQTSGGITAVLVFKQD